MSYNIYKKIGVGFLIPITISIIGWVTWVTKISFSAQQTQNQFIEYKLSHELKSEIIHKELEEINRRITDGFQQLNSKLDENIQNNNKIFLDFQKQLGQKNHE